LKYKQVIGFTGSVFLILMGSYFVFFKKVNYKEDLKSRNFKKGAIARVAVSGFLINTLNPSVIFFWLLNATAFAATHTSRQRITVFSVCLLVNMSADIGKVLMAGKLSKQLTLRNLKLINQVSGILLICFGLALFYGAFFMAIIIPSAL
ncbi:MAG: LysE family transporter, partial [Chitinophagaceae bacterium]